MIRQNCSVHRREPSDLEECVRVLAAVHAADGYPVHWPERPGAWLAPPSLLGAWVARREGQVIGHVGLCRSGPGDAAPALWSDLAGAPVDGTAVVGRLFVAPAARGHGVGGLLMATVVQAARERGLHPVLEVVSTDVAAAALYERLGWRRLATVDQEWTPGRPVTVHCYAAPLPA